MTSKLKNYFNNFLKNKLLQFWRALVMDDDTCENDKSLPQDPDSTITDTKVSLTFKSVTFSDGTTISLKPTDIVVLVGPNNSGKSVALRELENYVSDSSHSTVNSTVVKKVKFLRSGTEEELLAYLKFHTKKTVNSYNEIIYSGLNFSIRERNVGSFWSGTDGILSLASLFCMRLQTESRIIGSDPAPAFNAVEDGFSHPIQMLFSKDDLESKISGYFHQAFGEDLIVYRLGSNEIPLFVGQRLIPQEGEDRLSFSYCERLRDSTVPLKDQGDGMRSFASVILYLLTPITPSILILDEPEAFLHPPQAKLLGELIAKERTTQTQLFIATHSPDVLNGLLNTAPESLHVLRIERKGGINHIKELDKERAKAISSDPLMKYSSVMSGVFHERVIICESDADCMFYSSLLDIPEVYGDQKPDVLFVHANGKHRMATLAKALTELNIPVDIIADIDILKDDEVFKEIVETLSGNWYEIKPKLKVVRSSIESRKSSLNAREVSEAIREILEDIKSTDEFPKSKRSQIKSIFNKASPWDAIKEAGEAAIPKGDGTQRFKELQTLCKQIGLWIVPVGELEGFCKSVGGKGPAWVQKVIEEYDLSVDPNFQPARKFMQELWAAREVK